MKFSNIINSINIAQKNNKATTVFKKTKISLQIVEILYASGFIHSYKLKNNFIIMFFNPKNNKKLLIKIQSYYSFNNTSKVNYKNKDLWRASNGLFSYILSTSKGLMTCDEVKKNKTGGVVLLIVKQ